MERARELVPVEAWLAVLLVAPCSAFPGALSGAEWHGPMLVATGLGIGLVVGPWLLRSFELRGLRVGPWLAVTGCLALLGLVGLQARYAARPPSWTFVAALGLWAVALLATIPLGVTVAGGSSAPGSASIRRSLLGAATFLLAVAARLVWLRNGAGLPASGDVAGSPEVLCVLVGALWWLVACRAPGSGAVSLLALLAAAGWVTSSVVMRWCGTAAVQGFMGDGRWALALVAVLLLLAEMWPEKSLVAEPDWAAQGLSPREGEAVSLVLAGMASAEAARAMGARPSTVRNLLSRAYRKLGVSGQEELRRQFGPTSAPDVADAGVTRRVMATGLALGLMLHQSLARGPFLPSLVPLALGLLAAAGLVTWRQGQRGFRVFQGAGCAVLGLAAALGLDSALLTSGVLATLLVARGRGAFGAPDGRPSWMCRRLGWALALLSGAFGSVWLTDAWALWGGDDGYALQASVAVAAVSALVAAGLVWRVVGRARPAPSEPVADWRDRRGAYLRCRGLNPTQCQVLLLIMEGASGPEIARQLCVAPGTVKSARRVGYRVLGVHSAGALRDRVDAALEGRELVALPPASDDSSSLTRP